MKLVNVTPHTINIHANNKVTTIAPSGTVARVAATSEIVQTISDIPIKSTKFGALENLPEPIEGTLFIASMLVASSAVALGRSDVVSPGSLIRDDKGQPIGCDGLNLPS